MKRFFVMILFSVPIAQADTYTLTAGWTDPTPTGPNYAPTYGIEYQIAANPVVPVNGLTTPAWSASITANPADVIRVRAQARNTTGPIVGAWSSWLVASAPDGPTTPSDLTGGSLTVIWTGRP